MRTYSSRDVAMGLRTQLAMNSTELPKVQIIDSQMWQAVHYALDAEQAIKELDWLMLGAQLSSAMKNATPEVIGKLSETSVSSFIIDINEEDFLMHFGRQEQWKSLHTDLRINYYRARFSSIYWSAVRDFAVKSKSDCMSVFHIPSSLIEVLAESSTSQVIDFCHGYPHLQRFKLTCKAQDCLAVIKLVYERALHPNNYDKKLVATKMIKSNHCASNRAYCDY